jgi:hypothetical protein
MNPVVSQRPDVFERYPMDITLNLASTRVNLEFTGRSKNVARVYQYLFRDFLADLNKSSTHAKLKVIPLEETPVSFPWSEGVQVEVVERRISAEDVQRWLDSQPDYAESYPWSDRTLGCHCLDGVLLFEPGSNEGRLYVVQQDDHSFRSLYRLFWIYFAQVLGEAGGCFVHAAALIKGDKGYLFLGDSGAGKSTLAQTSEEGKIFSDDGPIVLAKDGTCWVYPSPYHQLGPETGLDKEVIHARAGIQGFYFLVKDSRNYVEPVPKRLALPLLVKRHTHFFNHLSPRGKEAVFDLFSEACNTVDSYNFHFRGDRLVWSVLNGH